LPPKKSKKIYPPPADPPSQCPRHRNRDMQRQDDYLINRTAMLLFIMQMTSLAGLAFRIAAQNRRVDDLLLRSFIRSEHVMLMLLAGIWGNVDTRGSFPGLDEFDAPPASACRRAELLNIAASFQQIAMALAMLLAMHPARIQGSPAHFVIPGRRSRTRNPAMGWRRFCSYGAETGIELHHRSFHLWIAASASRLRNDGVIGRSCSAVTGKLAQSSPSTGPKGAGGCAVHGEHGFDGDRHLAAGHRGTTSAPSPIALKLALTSYLVSLAIFIPISRAGWRIASARERVPRGDRSCSWSVPSPARSRTRCCLRAVALPAGHGRRDDDAGGAAGAGALDGQAASWSTPWPGSPFPASIGPLVGPPVGGFITTYSSWHWIFLINVPIGLPASLAVDAPPSRHRRRPTAPLDTAAASCSERWRPPASSSACRSSACRRCRPVGRARRRPGPASFAALSISLMRNGAAPTRADFRGCCQPDGFAPRSARRRHVPHRHRRDAVPAAADVPARLRPHALPVGHADLSPSAARRASP
jgi:hypothetical protein